MTRKQKRLAVIGGGMGFILAAVLLVMFAFSQSVAYFYMPADLAKHRWRRRRASASAGWSARAASCAAQARRWNLPSPTAAAMR